jgi:hypothetical protein
MSETLTLLKELISRQSITPEDADCQKLLSRSYFDIQNLQLVILYLFFQRSL